ncbi:MAG TPA: MmgE/PrpD family protein [Burkholderiales bacterium]|nr:MmgE/PrpD family protein [Burkholderiales bacterium]
MSARAATCDASTQRLVEFANRTEFDALPAPLVHETKRHLIDTVASAMGAYEEPVSRMARAIAMRSRGEREASVWGSRIKTTPEAAAFANGVMARSLDVSDTYLGLSRGHPSDMISGLLAVAEGAGANGTSLVSAIVLAYDVYCSFCDAIDINAKGWDQPVYGVLGCTLGAARLLGLSREQMGHAVSLALVPNMALAQSRRGHLSTWKGCAGANASRNAVFAAVLAREGFTGPTAVFEGDGGLWEAVGQFDWPLPTDSHLIARTHLKSLPVCYHGQSAVAAALALRAQVDCERIAEIRVDTYRNAVLMMGADPSRWEPKTRETADHSLPYCVSIALADGAVSGASFDDSRLDDPAIGKLMRKVQVHENPVFSSRYPQAAAARVTIRTVSGETHTKEVTYPLGHYQNPMSDQDLERKFHGLCRTHLGERERNAALAALWDIDRTADVGTAIARLANGSATH